MTLPVITLSDTKSCPESVPGLGKDLARQPPFYLSSRNFSRPVVRSGNSCADGGEREADGADIMVGRC